MSQEALTGGQPLEVSIFDPPNRGMKGRVAGGSIFMGSAQLIRMLTQIASVLILSRLLTPQDFGVMAMASPVLTFVSLLQDLGLTQATVQRPVLTQKQASSLFWANFVAGGGVALILCLTAPLASLFYRDGRVGEILLASAPLALFLSMGVQHRALLMRRMQYRKLMIRDVLSVLLSLATSAAVALIWRSYWALYAGTLAAGLMSTTAVIVATRWKPSRPAIDPELGKMMGFGAGLTGFTLTNFVARNMDSVLIGRTWGGASLGLYERSFKLLLFPLLQVHNSLVQVMTPALSRLNDDPPRYREAYMRVVRTILLASTPAILFMAVSADVLIPLAMGPKWAGVVPIFRALAVVAIVQSFNNPTGWLYVTQGRTGQYAQWGLMVAVLCTVSFAIGLRWGPLGVAVAYGISEVFVRTPLCWWFAGRQGAVTTGDLAKLAGPYVLAILATAPVLVGAHTLLAGLPLLGLFAVALLSYGVFWAVISAFPTGRGTLKEGWSLADGFVQKLVTRIRSRGAPARVEG